MKTTVQARLDEETTAALDRLARQLGMTRSEVIREGLRSMARMHAPGKPLKLIGAGKYDSGIGDLSTNKKHMEGFGMTNAQLRELAGRKGAHDARPARQQRNRRSA